MLHFVTRLPRPATVLRSQAAPVGLIEAWPLAALGALILPYGLYPFVGRWTDAFTLAKLWDGLWPILIGALLAALVARAGDRLPRAPVGDAIGVWERLFDQKPRRLVRVRANRFGAAPLARGRPGAARHRAPPGGGGLCSRAGRLKARRVRRDRHLLRRHQA